MYYINYYSLLVMVLDCLCLARKGQKEVALRIPSEYVYSKNFAHILHEVNSHST